MKISGMVAVTTIPRVACRVRAGRAVRDLVRHDAASSASESAFMIRPV